MSGPRMLDLPEEWAIPINTLVDLVRDQTTTTLEVADRIGRQKVIPKSNTGHKAHA